MTFCVILHIVLLMWDEKTHHFWTKFRNSDHSGTMRNCWPIRVDLFFRPDGELSAIYPNPWLVSYIICTCMYICTIDFGAARKICPMQSHYATYFWLDFFFIWCLKFRYIYGWFLIYLISNNILVNKYVYVNK